MKLDKKYFEDVIYLTIETHICFDPIPGRKRMLKILHKIAADAFAAGAEAQKEADKTAVKTVFELADNGGKMAMLMCAIARIQSATVKWEVPGE